MDHNDTKHTQNLDQQAQQADQNQAGPEAPKGAVLGTLAKSLNAHRENRRQRFKLQRQAARILGRERVGKCLWSVADLSHQVRVLRREEKARFDGLQTCGSVWHCPVCSHKVSETRRRELNDALKAAEQRKIYVALITLTFSHSKDDTLLESLEKLKDAKNHWHNSRTYKNHKNTIHGTITATEVTHGGNGWHPHYHILMFVDGSIGFEIYQMMTDLETQWITSLKKKGLTGKEGIAFDYQMGNAAGNYVAKWGAAEELTLTAKKQGKGKHPFELLEDSQHNPQSRKLFYEYAQAFKGKRQLFWSHGLKEAFGLTVQSDEEAAHTDPNNEDEWLFSFTREEWREVRGDKTTDNRTAILEEAEEEPIIDYREAGE